MRTFSVFYHCHPTLFCFACADPDDETDSAVAVEENNYLFETHASNMRLMTYAALLCSHPAHREEQTDMLTKFNVNEATLQ